MSGGIRGGEKLAARLKQIQEGLASRKKVEVGFFADTNHPHNKQRKASERARKLLFLICSHHWLVLDNNSGTHRIG